MVWAFNKRWRLILLYNSRGILVHAFEFSYWEHFDSAHGLVRCNFEAGVNAGTRGRMEVSLRCHNSPRRNRVRVTSRTGSAQRFVWEFEERQSRVLDAKREGSTFGARRREASLRPMAAARDGVQMNKTA